MLSQDNKSPKLYINVLLHYEAFTLFDNLNFDLTCEPFVSDIPTKILYAKPPTPARAMCPVPLVLLPQKMEGVPVQTIKFLVMQISLTLHRVYRFAQAYNSLSINGSVNTCNTA
jgi:hypothetical protein